MIDMVKKDNTAQWLAGEIEARSIPLHLPDYAHYV
jgi:hypothetical protein